MPDEAASERSRASGGETAAPAPEAPALSAWPVAEVLAGANERILIISDHAANAVPPAIDLGIEAALLQQHVGWDIGAAAVARRLAAELSCPAILATTSRLVVDPNRSPERAIPEESDGWPIPGNSGLDDAGRARRLSIHQRYHTAIAARIAQQRPALLVAIHSFTPRLRTSPAPRPWPIAILWNEDARAAEIGLAYLGAREKLPGPAGANEPYSGKVLNYTMNRHAEGNGIPYLGFETRQDLLADEQGRARFAGVIARTVRHTLAML